MLDVDLCYKKVKRYKAMKYKANYEIQLLPNVSFDNFGYFVQV